MTNVREGAHQHGEEQALAERCLWYITGLQAYFRSKGVPVDAVDDLVQDCLFVFWNKRARIHPGKRDQFLFGIAANHLTAYWRRSAQLQARPVNDSLESIPSTSASVGAILDSEEQNHLIEHCLSQLPPRTQEVMRLRFAEGLSVAQCARTLGLSYNTVREAEQRGLALVRGNLSSTEDSKPPAVNPDPSAPVRENLPKEQCSKRRAREGRAREGECTHPPQNPQKSIIGNQ